MGVQSEQNCHFPRESVPQSDVRIVSGIIPTASELRQELPAFGLERSIRLYYRSAPTGAETCKNSQGKAGEDHLTYSLVGKVCVCAYTYQNPPLRGRPPEHRLSRRDPETLQALQNLGRCRSGASATFQSREPLELGSDHLIDPMKLFPYLRK